MEIGREEGTDGAVHKTRDEDFIFGGTGLASEKATWDATQGAVFFLVFDLEGHEIGALNGLFLATHGSKNHGVAHLDHCGAVSLFCQLASFNSHNAAITQIKRCVYS